MPELNEDAIVACFALVGRCGATGFELAWTCPHAPGEEDGHSCPDVRWNAAAVFRGIRVMVDARHTATEAAMALAERLMRGAVCRCRRPVTLSDGGDGCRWRLVGPKWTPGCDVKPIRVPGSRGDLGAMREALAAPMNRKDRRAAKRR